MDLTNQARHDNLAHDFDMDGNARVDVANNGALVGTRRRVNIVPGSGLTGTFADDAANEKVDVTLDAATDGSTLEVSGDQLRVKDGGITQAKAATGLSLLKAAAGAPSGTTERMWYDTTNNLLYVLNSSNVWVCITPQSASVATAQTTTSASYAALATAGPAVTVTTGTKALVTLTCGSKVTGGNTAAYMSFAVSGATTLASSDTRARYIVDVNASYYQGVSAVIVLTGLTAGANTFTAQYKVDANTATFEDRTITVVGIP